MKQIKLILFLILMVMYSNVSAQDPDGDLILEIKKYEEVAQEACKDLTKPYQQCILASAAIALACNFSGDQLHQEQCNKAIQQASIICSFLSQCFQYNQTQK